MPDGPDDPPGNHQTSPRATHNQDTQAAVSSSKNAPPPASTLEKPSSLAASNPPATSHPMTASSSSSSHASAKDAANSANGPSPYGTRSRNRANGSRPNYAEDKESEMDYEYTSGPAKSNSTVDAPPSANQTDGARSAGVNTRRTATGPSNASSVTGDGGPSGNKALTSNSSNMSNAPTTNGVAGVSKKRKAGSSGLAAPPQNSTTNGHTATRRSSIAPTPTKLTNIMTFDECRGRLKDGNLHADDGSVLSVNDHVYLICEPPGEPYYLARIMEFLHKQNDPSNPIDALRVNWVYRPRDIHRKVTDSRLVFASMHSDTCPLTSLRGKCQIVHRSEIDDIDEYRKGQHSFWYEKMFDRYIHRFYEVIPVSQVINVPAQVKQVLDERWKYLIVEFGRGKELTSAVKLCKRCSQYCASNDSVGCAVCRSTYHMNCVDPPLQKKPSRGFAWACAACSRAQQKKLEARNTPIVRENAEDGEEDEISDERMDEDETRPPSSSMVQTPDSEQQQVVPRPATAEQIAQCKLWPYRYLGLHCRVEDALDYDDRIYPRAGSRLGPRHQANVNVWHGRPVEYVKAAEIKRKYIKGGSHKKDTKLTKDTLAALEADKQAKERRPKWVLDEPAGFVRRGEDKPNNDSQNTAKVSFRLPEVGEKSSRGEDDLPILQGKTTSEREAFVDDYISQAKKVAPLIGVEDGNTNFLDKALELLYANNFEVDKSLKKLKSLNRKKDLKEPEFSKEELKRFEDGITKFGSELHSVARYVKTQPHADIVRFYYLWKKTPRGSQIWQNYEGRKGKKEAKKQDASASKLVDDIADDQDDSAFDNDKSYHLKRTFACKFCSTHRSRRWRRAPGVAPGTTILAEPVGKGHSKEKGQRHVLALCHRCAELWRRYAVQWEEMDEVARKIAQGGGKAWKRRIDEELLKELASNSEPEPLSPAIPTPSNGIEASASAAVPPTTLPGEPPKKKSKLSIEKERTVAPAANSVAPGPVKKKVIEKPERSPTPERPKPRTLPCGVCGEVQPVGNDHLTCRECRLAVHRRCYGVSENRSSNKWICDTCANDKNPQISTDYSCLLCPVRHTDYEFVEMPKVSHKKKTDKDKDRERIDRERRIEAAEFYRQKQIESNKPVNPRETLKKTAGNNWAHVICALYSPEIRFGNAKALEPFEGIGMIPAENFEQPCKLCKKQFGACVGCFHCRAPLHPTCAAKAGYTMGFFMTTVKGNRRDHSITFRGKTGVMQQVISCKEHHMKGVSKFDEVDNDGRTALQIFAEGYKQANLTLTGTARKANLVREHTRFISRSSPSVSKALQTTNGNVDSRKIKSEDDHLSMHSESPSDDSSTNHRSCLTCQVDVSPKWWPVMDPRASQRTDINGDFRKSGTNGYISFSETASQFQCHKCHYAKVPLPFSPAPTPAPPPVATTPVQQPPHIPQPRLSSQPPQAPPSQLWATTPPRDPRASAVQPTPSPAQHQGSQMNGVVHSQTQHRSPHTLTQPLYQPPPPPHHHHHPPPAPQHHLPSTSPPQLAARPLLNQPLGMSPVQRPAYPAVRPASEMSHPAPTQQPLRQSPSPFMRHNQHSPPVQHQHPQPQPPPSALYGPPHESPRPSREGLPPMGGRAPSEGRTPGGASESPSLRNLLH